MAFRFLKNANRFFSDYYLGTVLGKLRGKHRLKTDAQTDTAYRKLQQVYARAQKRRHSGKCEFEFARPVLADVFHYSIGKGAEGIYSLEVDGVQDSTKPPLLVSFCSWEEDFDTPAERGRPTPTRALVDALRRAGVAYGLLVNGGAIRLVRADETSKGAYLEFDVEGCMEEPEMEDAQQSFAVAFRIFDSSTFVVRDGFAQIERIERESREHQQKVSEDLKRAVFDAAEKMVRGLLEDWQRREGTGAASDLTDMSEDRLKEFKDAALTCLYRLLFISFAEARDERLQEHALYLKSYSLATLLDSILEMNEEEIPANKYGYWLRLLALFDIYDKGLPAVEKYQHIPPRGGDFFSPETPAGRILSRSMLDDFTVAGILRSLCTTEPRNGIGRERVSFRELDIEQLGSVYEGLLEYEPRIAKEEMFEISLSGREFVLSQEDLIRFCEKKSLSLSGEYELIKDSPLEKLHVEHEEEVDEADEDSQNGESEEEETAEEELEEVLKVKKGTSARVLRKLQPGEFYFAPGSARKSSGSFYTPRQLVDDLVRHSLSPLVEGKTSAEIERLRILDPACGSAHFLVAACRFLGRELYARYRSEYRGRPPPAFKGDSDAWEREGEAWCKRRIAERCLYGVDLNPTAVNLAHVSLWIESLAGDRPLTYFEHHVRCGNSLIGTWIDKIGTPPVPKLMPKKKRAPERTMLLQAPPVREAIKKAANKRRLIDQAAEAVPAESLEEIKYKEDRRKEAEKIVAAAKLLCDLRCASAFGLPGIWEDFPNLLNLSDDYGRLEAYAKDRPYWSKSVEVRERERFFHWELEFPEVFEDGRKGFDAILSNPPWDKMLPSRTEFYSKYDVLIRAFKGVDLDTQIREICRKNEGAAEEFELYKKRIAAIAGILTKSLDYSYHEWRIDGKKTAGHEDIFKYFVERGWQLASEDGRVGYVVPSAMYNTEGCTGLRHLLLGQAQIERFYGFENHTESGAKIFPIDTRYKFVNLVFCKTKSPSGEFSAAFMRHDLDELSDEGAKPWVVRIRKKELERLSPGTLAFLEYRSPMDQEIILKMYEGRPLLGDNGPGTWNARFHTEFNMTNDRDLWTDPKTGKLYTPVSVLGYQPETFAETRKAMADAGFWPLYEGKMIEQWVVDYEPVRRWVNIERAAEKYGEPPDPNEKLVFRDIASNTNERTLIAALLPPRSCAGHSLNLIALPSTADASALVSVLNSLATDYQMRLRTVGMHLSLTFMRRAAVPSPNHVSTLASIQTKSVADSEEKHISEMLLERERVWEANRTVAEAYGIGATEMAHILDSFEVMRRKRPDMFSFFSRKIEEWKEES
jgi:hypothetical protein